MNINHTLIQTLKAIDDRIEYRAFKKEDIQHLLGKASDEISRLVGKHKELKALVKQQQVYGSGIKDYDNIVRVVCAAVIYDDGHIIIGIRHWSPDMHLSATLQGYSDKKEVEQGFVDQWGNFLTREEAKIIAFKRGQVKVYSEPSEKLYSEDLY